MLEKAEEICRAVLEKIAPKEDERSKIMNLAEEIIKKVAKTAEEFNVKAHVRLEGSVAKDTWLSGEPDIDVFIRMPKSVPREALGEIALKIAKKAVEGAVHIERFAEHPYLEAIVNGVRINIVPCYDTKPGDWRSATDRTPYHTDYVNKRLNMKLRGEIRLLKKFMKGIEVYGAEIKIGGFSGYLCELLILYYGSFLETLEAFAKIKTPVVIDIEGYYRNREDELKLLFTGPLVVVDPIDKARNVASAVQPQKLYVLAAASRAFLEDPDIRFFYPPEIKPLEKHALLNALKTRGSTLIFLTFRGAKTVPDILWGQLYKSQKALVRLLELNGFRVLRSACWSNEEDLNLITFELEDRFLPPIRKHNGPPLEKMEECRKFIQKYNCNEETVAGPYIEDGRWTVILRRRNIDAVKFLEENLKRDGGRGAGVAKEIAKTLLQESKLHVNEQIISLYEENGEFAKFLTDFLHGKPKWLKSI